MQCPRRAEIGANVAGHPFKLPKEDNWRRDGTCSYCGSLSPELFFKAVEDGCEVGPTDKNYKLYLHGEKAPKVHGACKVYMQHFDSADKDLFINLLNERKITFGYPGHLYVLPFFATRK